ncbi:MAG: hypothetical protein R2822_28555 [Spirosomataceae bacterium]
MGLKRQSCAIGKRYFQCSSLESVTLRPHYTLADIELLDEIVYLVEHKKHKLSAAKKIIETGRSQRTQINRTIEQLETVKRYLENLKEIIS